MKGNYTIKQRIGIGGFKRKLIRLLEQPSIVKELKNGIRPQLSLCCIEAGKLLGGSPKMFIDVGANIGEFSEACKFNFPEVKIIAFEPQIEHKDKIETLENIKVYPFGLWDKNTIKTFYVNTEKGLDDQSSFLKTTRYRGEKRKVELKRFDSLGIRIENPCFLKIDVEGAEDRVLKGFGDLLKEVDIVELEVSHQELFKGISKVSTIIKLMEKNDFKGFKQLNLTYEGGYGRPEKSDLIFFK